MTIYERVYLAFVLFMFWIVLSQKLDLLHLTEGFVISALVSVFWRHYSLKQTTFFNTPIQFFRFLKFLPWLFWQIIMSNIRIAWVILQPKPPISPKIVHFKLELPSSFARFVLSNAITLTPGTVTLDQEGDYWTIHTLTEDALAGLLPEGLQGSMQAKIKYIFEDESK